MDASPAQSGSKCGGSDFSIERILADKKESRDDSVEAPDWLCCTRYRPPRLPRSGAVCRARRAGRHARVPFTAAQAAALESAYARAPYLAPPALKALAAALQLRDDRIKIWFQNRRARERREKCTTITPPQGVTLPPTTIGSGFPSNPWIAPSHFSIRNSQVVFNPQFNGLDRCTASKRINPDSLTTQRYITPLNLENNCSKPIWDCTETIDEDRPDTPLDIETVED